MTDDELAIASVPAASDLLEEHGLPGAAEMLREAPARAALLERAVAILEAQVVQQFHNGINPEVFGREDWSPRVALIAEHRGETPGATLARLGPPSPQSRSGGRAAFMERIAYAAEASGLRVHRARRGDPANLPVRAPEPVQMTTREEDRIRAMELQFADGSRAIHEICARISDEMTRSREIHHRR
jgi:hypothetical protein